MEEKIDALGILEKAIEATPTTEEYIADLERQLAEAKAEIEAMRWIPITESLPELKYRDDSHVPGGAPATLYSDRVLVFDGSVRIDNLVQAEGREGTKIFYVGTNKPITHWMPLPVAPRKQP